MEQVNKKRLHKSSDAIISGVCGGIAEYFGIDPTLVRIIAVVLAIVGMGFPVILYVACMFIMPPDPAAEHGYVDTQAERTEAPCQRIYANVSNNFDAVNVSGSANAADEPPPPDPATRVTASQYAAAGKASTGSFASANAAKGPSKSANNTGGFSSVSTNTKNKSTIVVIGAVLIGIGIMALLCNFIHISLWRFWPLVIVVAGLVTLFTPGPKGWSLERAGNAIVFITIGLVLLAWMLQIIQTRTFVAAFSDLWPLLLVVVGLAIIGGARKSSAIMLFSSLVLAGTILVGVWLYAGVDWASLGVQALLTESDGIQEFLSDLFIFH